MNNVAPHIGQWYQSSSSQDSFEVVAICDNGNFIEIQYFDGNIDEIDIENWDEFTLDEIGEPSDWSGALEVPLEDLDIQYQQDSRNNPQEHW